MEANKTATTDQATLEEQLMNAHGDAVGEIDSLKHKLNSGDSEGNADDQDKVPLMDANGDDHEAMLQEDGDDEVNPEDETIDEQPDTSHDAEESGSLETFSSNKKTCISTASVVTSTPKAPLSGQPKPANVSAIPSKGDNADSRVYEEGDDSFVVQVDDTVLNDIDSDLLAQEKSADGATTQSSDIKKADASGDGSEAQEATADANDTEANTQETTNKDEKEGKTTAKSGGVTSAKKDQKSSQCSRNLWVSGLSSLTRASDLKTRFSKYGKVVGAKVVANAKNPRARCYGLVTMGTADEATKCIQHIHRTELHGRLVSVERAKTEPLGGKAGASKVLPPSCVRSPTKTSSRPSSSRRASRHASSVKEDEKKNEAKIEDPAKSTDEKEKDGQEEKKDASGSTSGRKSGEKSDVSDKARRDMTLDKIKAERERRRLINKEIQLRQEERRHQMTLERERFKQQQRAKRMSEEAVKMEREKRKLRDMREELERERMKTERLKLETERLQIERERERVLQERRPVKRHMGRDDDWSGSKRPASDRFQTEGRQFERKADRFDRREPERGARYDGWREERTGRHDRDNAWGWRELNHVEGGSQDGRWMESGW